MAKRQDGGDMHKRDDEAADFDDTMRRVLAIPPAEAKAIVKRTAPGRRKADRTKPTTKPPKRRSPRR